jgi:hypothetical protein
MKKASGKRGREGKRSKDIADRDYEQENDSDTSRDDEERGATKKRKRSGSRVGMSWSQGDDLQLKKLREEDGLKWEEIAKSFPGRSKDACRNRYSRHVKDGEDTVFWSKESDLQLKKLREEDGLIWEEIAKFFPGRTANACSGRYLSRVKEGGETFYWSKDKTLQLKKLREEDGLVWQEIVKSFPGRSVRSCQARYERNAFDGEKRVQVRWSNEADLQLTKLREEDGLKWEDIAKFFPGRSVNSCQTRYGSHVKEGETTFYWSTEADLQLKKLREEDNGLTYEDIANSFPGRSKSACQTRYLNTLKK